jgi:hypothetical protein
MKSVLLALVLLVLAVSIEASVVATGTNTLNLTNDQTAQNASAATEQLQLNIDPDIVNPDCGGIYPANLNVKYGLDPFYLSTVCQQVLSFIGGNKGKQNVDIVWTCPGEPTNGTGDRDTFVILNTPANNALDANAATEQMAADMEIHRMSDGFFLSAEVLLGVKNDASGGKATFQFIFC